MPRRRPMVGFPLGERTIEAAALATQYMRERDAARAENKRLRAELAMVRGVLVWLARDLAEQKAAVLFDAPGDRG